MTGFRQERQQLNCLLRQGRNILQHQLAAGFIGQHIFPVLCHPKACRMQQQDRLFVAERVLQLILHRLDRFRKGTVSVAVNLGKIGRTGRS
ncbi:hypothetical protein D3C73_974560 [compost metagenome]